MAENTLKLNNRGFSLLELIVSFAILAFIMAAIVGLMAAGMRFFRQTSSSIGLQYEYQTVMAQIREYIVDCNEGIAFDEAQQALYIINSEVIPAAPAGSGDITRYTVHVFIFDAPSSSLYYMTGSEDDDGTPGFSLPLFDLSDLEANGSLASQRVRLVEDASVTPAVPGIDIRVRYEPGISPPKVLQVSLITDMEFFSGSREYRAKQTIALRNRIDTADNYTDLCALVLAP